jgi:hypothetical protein
MCFGRHLKNGHHSHNFFLILPNFKHKLEIPNIMLVCKFEINWSTNKNLRALTLNKGRSLKAAAESYQITVHCNDGTNTTLASFTLNVRRNETEIGQTQSKTFK